MKFTEMIPWFSLKCHSPVAKCRIKTPSEEPRVLEIDHLPLVIGRSEEADIRLADHWVSRVHCCLTIADGWLVVRDLESRHGTVVNGSNIHEQALHPGDRIYVGMTTLEILEIASGECLLQSKRSSDCATKPKAEQP